MTLQWTAVALFLYIEIGILILLCLPFISAQRWQMVFNLNIWNHVAWLWKRVFLAMIIILIVLFLDAVREVRKYSGTQINKDSKMYANMVDHLHMKLFRSQRNLYISGFALLLWLVMQRVIMLINQLAAAANTNSALHAQIEDANQAAKKYMEETEQLKQPLKVRSKIQHQAPAMSPQVQSGQALKDCSEDEQKTKGNECLRNEVHQLKQKLKTSTEALNKSKSEADAIKKQTETLAKDYDHLLQNQQKLQSWTEIEDKKDI